MSFSSVCAEVAGLSSYITGDIAGGDAAILKMTLVMVEAAEAAHGDVHRRAVLLGIAMAFPSVFLDLDCYKSNADWDKMWGPQGQRITECVMSYDYSTMFSEVAALASVDGVGVLNSGVFPMLYHYGDIAAANAINDRCLINAEPLLGGPFTIPDESANTIGNGMLMWPLGFFELGRDDDAKKQMLMMQVDPARAEASWDKISEMPGAFRPRGNSGLDGGVVSIDACERISRATWTLVTGEAEVDGYDLLSVPSPDELCAFAQTAPAASITTATIVAMGSMVWPALAFERQGLPERAMAFAAKALEDDLTRGGNRTWSGRSLAHACRGRLLAAAGRQAEAVDAFKAAVAMARQHALWLLEVYALLDCEWTTALSLFLNATRRTSGWENACMILHCFLS